MGRKKKGESTEAEIKKLDFRTLVNNISEKTGIPPGDVDLVFEGLGEIVINELSQRNKVETNIGVFSLRDYGWINYEAGLFFSPSKKLIHNIREAYKKIFPQ